MSRYGNSPIALPKGVEVKKSGAKVSVKGPKGELNLDLKEGIELDVQDESLHVSLKENSKLEGKDHGLYRSLVNNMIVGVSSGFEKRLTLIGVGFRAAIKGTKLDLQLGFSHPTEVDIPKDLEVAVEKSTTIIVKGKDKQQVGQFAASVRALRPPEPYKGKGVRYEDEYVRKKAGKSAKS